MESLQLAQMLADLSDLNAAQEAKAALAVVEANKTLPPAATSDTATHAAASTSKPTEPRAQRQINEAKMILPEPHHSCNSTTSEPS